MQRRPIILRSLLITSYDLWEEKKERVGLRERKREDEGETKKETQRAHGRGCVCEFEGEREGERERGGEKTSLMITSPWRVVKMFSERNSTYI